MDAEISELLLNDLVRDLIKKIAKDLNYKKYDFKITSRLGKGDNYLGVIKRAVMKGDKHDGKEERLYLILKTPPADGSLRKEMPLNSIYDREVYVYKVFLPMIDELQMQYNIKEDLGFKYAKCYSSSTNDLNEAIILEDLNAKGFKMFDRLISLDYDHIMLIVKTLSRFHSLSFAAKEKLSTEIYEDFKKHTTKRESLGENFEKSISKMWKSGVKHIQDVEAVNKLERFEENLIEKFYTYLNLNGGEDGQYNIITHGDSWINNMLFKYENSKPTEMILVDWQMIRYCSPVTDLVYFLFSCIDEEIRTRLWDEILNTYYNTLKERLIDLDCDPEKCYPERVFLRDMKTFGGLGLIMALITIPLFLNKRENSIDASDMIGEDGFDAEKIQISNESVVRLNGVVRHCIKLNII